MDNDFAEMWLTLGERLTEEGVSVKQIAFEVVDLVGDEEPEEDRMGFLHPQKETVEEPEAEECRLSIHIYLNEDGERAGQWSEEAVTRLAGEQAPAEGIKAYAVGGPEGLWLWEESFYL